MEASYTFTTDCRWTGERRGKLVFEGKPDIEIASPPEFGGPPGTISPEDLFVGTACSCYLTAFLTMADKVGASFVRFSCVAEATLENVEGQGLIFTTIVFKPRVDIMDIGEEDPIRRALALAKRYCLVTNSMTCEVEVIPEVVVI